MDLVSYIGAVGEQYECDKGVVIFNQGDTSDDLYYVETGLLKAFYVTVDGKEFVKSFIREGNVIGSLTALVSNENCSFSLVSLEPCSLRRIKFSDLTQAAEKDILMANTFIKLLFDFSMKKERREYEFLCLSAEKRYQLIKEQTPDLLDRVTQNDIARYLGITPVALSRIRNRTAALLKSSVLTKNITRTT